MSNNTGGNLLRRKVTDPGGAKGGCPLAACLLQSKREVSRDGEICAPANTGGVVGCDWGESLRVSGFLFSFIYCMFVQCVDV
jgi:hypothetical protein